MKKEKKNKSYIEIKEDNNDKENIINPLEKYKYIEPKKKINIKKILLVVFSIISIFLIIILLKIIDNNFNKNEETNNTETTNKTTSFNTTTQTTDELDAITETLVCSTNELENNMQIETIITAKFHNKKLREDSNKITIKLLDESSKEDYDKYISVLQMFSLYLTENSGYDITYTDEDNEFSLEITTTYQKDKKIDSNLEYDEDYDSVKQKLIELGNNCN